MKNLSIPLLSLSLGLSSVFAGTITHTFDSTLGDFVPGGDAGATPPVWSNVNGGSMMLEFVGGWAPAKAELNLVTSAFYPEFQSALTKGGSIKFDITVRTDDIMGGFPGWFEPMLSASSGYDDRPFGGNDNVPAYYGAGGFPTPGQIRTTTVTLPIEPAGSGVADDGKVQFNPNSATFRIQFGLNSQGGAAFTSGKYFVDNFSVSSNAQPVVIPPPATGLEPTVPGMNIYSSGTGQYDRQTLRTTTPQYSWIGVATPSNPVTYSLTISNYSSKPGMGTVFYLVPGTGLDVGQNFPDYGQPRCIAGYLNSNADGTANLRLAYKNELGGSNGTTPNDLYGGGSPNDLWPANPAWVIGDPKAPGTGIGGTLASVNGTSILGKWSISFTSNTSVTITSPGGQTASGTLPNEATAQLWADPMYAYFGTVPGVPERIGERVVFSNVAITGGPNTVIGDIDANLASSLLEKSASNAPGIVFINPSDQPYWFTWTLPATDYILQQSTDLGTTSTWTTMPLASSIPQPRGRRLLLNAIDLLSPTKNFLRMYKPQLVP